AIYLSPGTGPVDPSTVAYITTHEMGHVLTWAFIDDYPARWNAYMELRQLDESSLAVDAIHADRAREILAEDIRALFGGPLATVAGSIENHDLVHPQWVDGLKSMLAGFFLGGEDRPLQMTSSAFPNPCNPRTSIEMALPVGLAAESGSGVLRIFDIRGALVNTLRGGEVANHRLVIQWDGTGRSGSVVSSGRYIYVLEVGQVVSKGSVTLVR
ncbi:MAG: FlgD immunoglobulin-like domain containing protein, partial [Candidatus Krumholzibacteriota bacterium]